MTNTNFNDTSSTGKAGAFGSTAFADAADDYFFVQGAGDTTGTVLISGLTVNVAGLNAFTIEAVPEPNAAILLGLAGFACLMVRRRR